jgi:hypothetical protein
MPDRRDGHLRAVLRDRQRIGEELESREERQTEVLGARHGDEDDVEHEAQELEERQHNDKEVHCDSV